MSVDILKELKEDFLIYASEVNQNRSFPDVRDGLKPGQRAALWEMFDKGYSSNKPHVKSAKVTGGVIANWWAHGDASAYESIVRMSQYWVNNIPEVDWHGANGSPLSGPEAASARYTECRLATAAEDGFFTNMKKKPVDMIPNFSEDLEWPRVFPSIFPRLFVNGSQGIGYTIAQEWEPGNLKEFETKVKTYLKTGSVNCDDIYPDYPTGGLIINKNDIHKIYETGTGSIILRAKTEIVDNIIKITELPYQVYVEPFIQKVKDLVNSNDLTGIEDICNKSGDEGLLIEIECSGSPELVLAQLFKLTDLQVTFSANQMALVNGVPTLLNLENYIKVYTEHNISCIKREYEYDLDKAVVRLNIVEGLVKAINSIDSIIALIRCSKSQTEAITKLVDIGYNNEQARAIVDMKLGKLANLEINDLLNEQKALNETITDCKVVIEQESKRKEILLTRLKEFTKKYGWERRTSLCDIDISEERAIIKTKKKSEEQYVIALTKGNYIKRIKLVDYKKQNKIYSESERIISDIIVGPTTKLFLLSEAGKLYKLQANKISLCTLTSSGTSLTELFNDRIINIFNGSESQEFTFFITKNGKVKKLANEVLFSISKKAGTEIMKLDSGDTVIDIRLVNAEDAIKVNVSGKIIKLDVAEFKAKGKSAGGVTGIKLGKSKEILEVI